MKKNLFVLLGAMLVVSTYAQERLNPLKTPTSPASSILGLQPTVVLAPKSYEALEAAVYSNAVGDGGFGIPNDFALEFTPYWMKDHSLSIHEYLYPKTIKEQLWRNASFSVASTQNFVLNDTVETNAIALGFRTTLYIPNKADRREVEQRMQELRSSQTVQAAIGAQMIPLVMSETAYESFWEKSSGIIETFLRKAYPGMTSEEIDAFLEDLYEKGRTFGYNSAEGNTNFVQLFMNHIDSILKGEQLYNEFEDYIKNRYGLSVDIAYSNLISFPTNTFEFSFIPRQGIWVTPSYKFKDQWHFLKIQAVLRYEWYNTGYYDRYFDNTNFYRNNFDYGISLVGEFNRFSVQFEGVGRSSSSEIPSGFDADNNALFRKVKASDFQYIATFAYNLTEQINLSYSLGNRFEPVNDPQSTLVSFLGLNFGFGAADKSDLDLTLANEE